MIPKRCLARWKKNAARKAGDDLHLWLTSIGIILEAGQGSFRREDSPSDIGVTLDRIDRELMRLRNHAAAVRRPLRRADPDLARRVEDATEQAFHLRNQTCAYLMRWLAVQQHDPRAAGLELATRRQMEEALLAASRTADQLSGAVGSLAGEGQAWIDRWSED